MVAVSAAQSMVVADDYVAEYMRCKNNFHYFCATYIYIEIPGKDILLTPYNKQSELIDRTLITGILVGTISAQSFEVGVTQLPIVGDTVTLAVEKDLSIALKPQKDKQQGKKKKEKE